MPRVSTGCRFSSGSDVSAVAVTQLHHDIVLLCCCCHNTALVVPYCVGPQTDSGPVTVHTCRADSDMQSQVIVSFKECTHGHDVLTVTLYVNTGGLLWSR